MNRNAESHFSQLPQANIERSRFDRSHSIKFTGNTGDLIPFLCEPILPGDTWEIDTSKILRLQTMVSPVMDSAFLDIYYFFVPNRLIWTHWKEFMGENTQSAWYPLTQYNIPKIMIPTTGVHVGSLMDYLGIPPYPPSGAPGNAPVYVNALRLRGYLQICQEWFRDQNLEDPLNFELGDSTTTYDFTTAHGGAPFKAAKMHDYFTSCLPGPQKSPQPVSVPTTGLLPVITAAPSISSGVPSYPLTWQNNAGSAIRYTSQSQQVANKSGDTINVLGSVSSEPTNFYAPINLVAVSSAASGFNSISMSVTDLRLAFQTQKFLEKQARGGSRYREILLSHFGVVSPDARQQVPEYLGGNRIPLNIQQVVNSAETADQPLGNLGAFSQTTDVHSDVFKSFTEHGYLYGLAVVRYDHCYSQSADRDWFVNDMYDFYWPVFASISEQPVYTREIYFPDAASGEAPNVFGYQEAWASYRYAVNRVAGEMRPYVTNGLSSWSFADVYAVRPTLSESWIKEDKANIDRTLAVTSETANQFWADFYVKATVTRPMPLYSVPGLVDHF